MTSTSAKPAYDTLNRLGHGGPITEDVQRASRSSKAKHSKGVSPAGNGAAKAREPDMMTRDFRPVDSILRSYHLVSVGVVR